ncbi:MAG: hypothetical protein D6710_05125 [Nitrospirae bacterium]|nr:MAG: hypothetical protein D6710_05125 [Nitrospirota bacterium]
MHYRLVLTLIAITVFLVTALTGRGVFKSTLAKRDEVKETYKKVARLGSEYEYLKKRAEKKRGGSVNTGVLTFIENVSRELGLTDRIGSIKPVPGKKEQVEVSYTELTLKEMVDIFSKIRSFNNLRILSFSIKKRFDRPEFAELRIQLEKL